MSALNPLYPDAPRSQRMVVTIDRGRSGPRTRRLRRQVGPFELLGYPSQSLRSGEPL